MSTDLTRTSAWMLGAVLGVAGCGSTPAPQTPAAPAAGSETSSDDTDAALRRANERLYAGDIDRGVAELDDALAETRAAGTDTLGEARLLSARGRLLTYKAFVENAGIEDAQASLAQAVSIASAHSDAGVLMRAKLRRTTARYVREYLGGEGQYEPLVAEFQAVLRLAVDIDDQRSVAEAEFYLGLMRERLGDAEAALKHYQRSLSIAQRFEYKLEASFAVRHIGLILYARGEVDAAHERLAASLALREEIGFRVYLPFSYLSMGGIEQARGRHDAALAHYDRARESAEQLGYRRVLVLCDLSAGDAHHRKGDSAGARELFRRAEQAASEIGFARGLEIARKRLAELDE